MVRTEGGGGTRLSCIIVHGDNSFGPARAYETSADRRIISACCSPSLEGIANGGVAVDDEPSVTEPTDLLQ